MQILEEGLRAKHYADKCPSNSTASIIIGWNKAEPDELPVLAIPQGQFMQHLSPEARDAFGTNAGGSKKAGFSTVNVQVLFI